VEKQRVDSPWHNMESPNIGRPEKNEMWRDDQDPVCPEKTVEVVEVEELDQHP
jgi:hypothetical protein